MNVKTVKILRNLLPVDSRNLEFANAFSFIVSAIGIFLFKDHQGFEYLLIYHFHIFHSHIFWSLFFGIIGGLQLYSLLEYPELEPIRLITSWISGAYWVWSGMERDLTTAAILSMFVGIYLLLAFIINAVALKDLWKK